MILYHFAFLKVVDGHRIFMKTTIEGDQVTMEPAPEGLTPHPGSGWGSCELQNRVSNAPEVVWLTTDPRTVPGENSHIFRVAVKIPSTDRRLINWPKWRDRYVPDVIPADDMYLGVNIRGLTKAWWGYAGAIPLSKFVSIELLRNQQTPWAAAYDRMCVMEKAAA